MSGKPVGTVGLFLLFLIPACASSGSQQEPTIGQERERVEFGTAETLEIFHDERVHDEQLTASRAAVWSAVTEAHAGIGLGAIKADANTGLLVSNTRVSQKFAGKPLSSFFDCGTSMTGPRADSYQLYITVSEKIDSVAAGQTRLRTLAEALAANSGSSAGAVRCTSTGNLEKFIVTLVTARLK